MEYTTLGKTGLKASVPGFGGIPILRLQTDEAVRILRHALDRGITFYDTANMYGDSETKIGIAFSGMREKVVLATKTLMRDAAGATKHLENSLRCLKTDCIDLFQLHQVADDEAYAVAMAPGGAYEAVVKAKEAGKIRHIGVSSHNLQMAIKLVKSGLFETIQFPFNFIETEPTEELFPSAQDLGVGIIAMKPFGGGAIDNGALCFKYLRQFPQVIPIPGYDSFESVESVLSFYEQPNDITAEDMALMDKYRAELGKSFCRRCEYCQPCPNGVSITNAMGYPVIVARMSTDAALPWLGPIMETIPNCTECGECIERCPYDLQIPELLKQNFDIYVAHRDSAKK